MAIGPEDQIDKMLVKKYQKANADKPEGYKKGTSIVSPRTVLNSLGGNAALAGQISPNLGNYKNLCAQMIYKAPKKK